MEYKSLLTLVYYYNKLHTVNRHQMSILNPFNKLISSIKQRNNKFNGLFAFKRRFIPNKNSVDGDDLNLAENQIFDECLFTDEFYFANQLSKSNSNNSHAHSNNNSNPYCNLTIST